MKSVSILTATSNDNIWAGSAYEYMRGPGVVSAGVTASLISAFLTIQSGPDVILEESPVMVLPTPFFPIVPDHFYFNWGAAPGDRLLARVRNANGATNVISTVCNIQYTAGRR